MNVARIASSSLEFNLIYVIRLIGFLGVLLNSLGLIVMLNKTLLHPMYKFTWCRTICNALVCFFACGIAKTIDFDLPGTYFQKVFQTYLIALPLRMAYFSSTISDFILILNRFFVITERRVRLLNISKIANLAICCMFPIFFYMPSYFIFRLEAFGSGETYVFKLTHFGQTKVFQIWAALVYLLETFLGVVVLGFFNVLSVVRFREKMRRKAHLLKNRTETRRAEIMFTKMVLILTTICLITRLIDVVARALVRLHYLKMYEFSDVTKSWIVLYHDVSSVLIVSSHAFDILVYILMDPNLRRCTIRLFCRPATETANVSCIFYCSLIMFINPIIIKVMPNQ